LKTKQERHAELLAELNKFLAAYGYEAADGADEINGNLTALESRWSQFREARRDKQEAEKEIEAAQTEIEELTDQREELFTDLNLEVGAREELVRLCSQREDYLQLRDEAAELEAVRNSNRETLKQEVGFKEELLTEDLTTLETRKENLELKVADYEEIHSKIKEIETKISQAKKETGVETALAEKERSLNELAEELETDYAKLTGQILADHLQAVNSPENQSEVFKRARELFTLITRGEFELRIDQTEPPSFQAIDRVNEEEKELEELSSGTRVQLLLAVRMAFLDQEEQGIVLPLYLDETLANADEQRAEAIIKAVLELSRQGRQCFYFTARRDEVAKWVSVAKLEGIKTNVINLSDEQEVNSEAEEWMDSSLEEFRAEDILPEADKVPAAAGLSHTEYGDELSVPSFNPRQGASALHLWYLIEDLDLLESLLKQGIDTWGQLKTLLEAEVTNFFPAEKQEQLAAVRQRGKLAADFVDCWQIGRGKEVDRSVLLASEAVSDNFIEEVVELAEEVNGEARAVIEKLRSGAVTNFRQDKIAELEEHFRKNGYIAQEKPLSGGEIRSRLLASAAGEMEEVDLLLKRLLE
jgi:hypothetical protein